MINKNIKDFINTNSKQCRIVTGNLDAWIKPLQKKINCKFYTSTSTHNGKIIEKVMKKGEILKKYKNYTKIFIGDGFNDISAFREAHIKIAVNFIHKPPEQLINMCNYYFSNSKKLCQFLEQL